MLKQFLMLLFFSNLLVFMPEGSFLRLCGAITLLLLPGPCWCFTIATQIDWLSRWLIGLGLSYIFLMIFGLVLHYIPGPITFSMIWLTFNTLTLIGLVMYWQSGLSNKPDNLNMNRPIWLALLLILLYGGIFRFTELGYSEFQGDEVRALMPAAGALEGQYDAIFNHRKKGPGEIILPAIVWRLTGTVTEFQARFLFAFTGILLLLTMYRLSCYLLNEKIALVATALLALNGFMIAFSRIVQYQMIVLLMSLLAILTAWLWYQYTQLRWALLSGLFIGGGILAHYDTILVAPAIFALIIFSPINFQYRVRSLLTVGLSSGIPISLFFVPYLFRPQLAQATTYLSDRIGSSSFIENSLHEFFRYSVFYLSLHYVVLTWLLVLGFLWRAFRHLPKLPAPQAIATSLIGIISLISVQPELLDTGSIDLAVLPFSLLFLGATFSPVLQLGEKMILLWLATSFLGYNFAIADPRTHIYTIYPAWSMIAAISGVWIWKQTEQYRYLSVIISMIFIMLVSGYLYIVYLRQDIEFETDWPKGNLALYWYPYSKTPQRATFGFVHKTGWKGVGGLYADALIEGEYQTNSDYPVTDWYVRNQLLGCYDQAKHFFAPKHQLIDPNRFIQYERIAEIDLLTDKGINIYQKQPITQTFGQLDYDRYAQSFDETAWPFAFAPPIKRSHQTNVNFLDTIQLENYVLTTFEPYPGNRILLILYWKSLKYTPLNLDVFIHLEDANTHQIWQQSNGTPGCGESPTFTWQLNDVINDRHLLQIPHNIPPGNYQVVAGLYLPEHQQRIPVLDSADQIVADSTILFEFTID